MAVKKYGLDLGSANIRIFQSGQGIVIKEKNMIAVQKKKDVIAVGNAAYEMYEKTPRTIVVSNPIKGGVIADTKNMNSISEALLKKAGASAGFMRNNSFYLAVPSDVTEVEKRAYFDLMAHSVFNTHNVYICEKPVAAAIGEGLKIYQKRGFMLVDMGCESTEITVMTMNGVVISKLLHLGGHTINTNIQDQARSKHHLVIGDKTAEYLKLELGNALPEGNRTKTVSGRDLVTGLPVSVEINEKLIFQAMRSYLIQVLSTVKKMLEKIPPQLREDIESSGICFTGGTSQIPGLEKLFKATLNLNTVFSLNPTESVVRGLGMIIDHPNDYKDMIFSLKDSTFN